MAGAFCGEREKRATFQAKGLDRKFLLQYSIEPGQIILKGSIQDGPIYARFACALFLLTFVSVALAQNYRSPLVLAPYSLDFGEVQTGKTSSSQTVTIVNTGTQAQEISSVSITGDFAEATNCPKPPATLAPMTDCEIQVTFKPSTPILHSGTLTISDAASGTQLTVTLSGAGIEGRPTITISPDSLTFPDQQTGGNSPAKTVVVTNTGTKKLVISNVEVHGDFMALPTSTCINVTGPIAPGASCTLQIVFVPLAVGLRNGEVLLLDNAEDSPNKVVLSGIGK